jgi:hypothetical protein
MISGPDGEILVIVARFPGSAHDSFIWRVSGIRLMLNQSDVDGYLVGKIFMYLWNCYRATVGKLP